MTKIVFDYDHYMGESKFSDGNSDKCEFIEARIRDKKDLAEWAGEFLKYLEERYNDTIELEFTGIQQDCDTMEDAVEEFNKMGSNRISLILKGKGASKSGGKVDLGDLRKLYDEIKSINCPFDDLRDNRDIEVAFKKGTDTEFEIAVVATMSSGKSTLINAMLGKELLPARNEATTATITRIHDTESERFSCQYVDISGQEQEIDPVTLEDMNNLNNLGIPDIDIYGKIQGIDTQALRLVLADTPGPNNSRTSDHKEHTYRLIKDSKFKPMILYILNATQLETNDDNTLLREISEAMRSGGRQASDRFIFVMNKADEFDPEKGESVERMMEKTEGYLARHGIENPRLFPCSAYYAKLLRQVAAGVKLTRAETLKLPGMVQLFIEDEEMHFSNKATVSDEVKKLLDQRLQQAIDKEDEYEQALIHTGIPAVEEAINEYLDKYAIPAKIKEALTVIMQTINDSEVESKANTELAANEQELQKVQQALKSISEEIKRGDEANKLKEEISSLRVTEQVELAYQKLAGKKFPAFSKRLKNKYQNNSAVRQDKVQNLKEDVNEQVKDLQNELAIDIENIINTEIGDKAQELMREYNGYVERLMGKFDFVATPASLVGHLAHMRDFTANFDAGDYEFEQEEIIGSHKETRTKTRIVTKKRTETRQVKRQTAGGKIKRFFGRIFNKDWGYDYESYEVPYQVEQTYEEDVMVNDYGKVKYVDFSRMVTDYVSGVVLELDKEARKLAFEEANVKADELKEAFKKEFDRLNKAMKVKLEEKENSLQDEKSREDMIRKGKESLAWIASFKKKLRQAIGN